MKKIYLLAVACASAISCLAQSPMTDSLKRVFPTLRPHQYITYFSVLDKHLSTQPLPVALSTIERLQATPPAEESLLLVYFFNTSLYRAYFYHHKYVLADSMMQQNLRYTRQKELKIWEAETLYELGYLYANLSKYPEAVRYLEEASALFYQHGWQLRSAILLYDMGDACYHLNEKEGCPEYFIRALRIGKDSLSSQLQASSHNTLGLMKLRTKDYRNALTDFRNSYHVAVSYKDTAWIGIAQGNIGQCLVKLNKPDEALTYLQQDLRINKQYNDWRTATRDCHGIGDAYRLKRNLPLAIDYYEQGIAFAKKAGELGLLNGLYRDVAQACKENRQMDKAFFTWSNTCRPVIRWLAKISRSRL